MDCASCHTPDGWEISRQKWAEYQLVDPTKTPPGPDTTKFSHDRQTSFPLTGSHQQADCRSCHASMVFEQASGDCISCHTDLHQMTVGNDCARCHNTDNWQVNDIFGLHQQNGFPLTGAHATCELQCLPYLRVMCCDLTDWEMPA
jgi:protein-arginine kinase activator protein McsA